MTVEKSFLVAVPGSDEVGQLVRDIVSAGERSLKADPGDRVDVTRYEMLCVQLEAVAARSLGSGADHRILEGRLPAGRGYCFDDSSIAADAGRLSARLPEPIASTVRGWCGSAKTVVELRQPLEIGATVLAPSVGGPPDVAKTWEVDGDMPPSRAASQRFRAQMEAVLASDGADRVTRDRSINPSSVNNRILTQALRDFVIGEPRTRVDAPVTYRDGSEAANPFPLRCLPLVETPPPGEANVSLRLALLSIRHTEMDAVVDGAWLRNADVSRPRPAALTDDFVFGTSVAQFRELTDGGRRTLEMHIYQTGLDTAIVGFYRAVAVHLLAYPFSLTVIPMFYAAGPSQPGLAEHAPFRPGKAWTMGARR